MIDSTLPPPEPEATIPLLEEKATITTRDVKTGGVRVSTHVETIEDVARADLSRDQIEVTRVPIGRRITGTLPEVRTEGDLTIVPLFEEVIVTEKHLMLKEELHIRKLRETEAVELPLTRKRQWAEIERSNDQG